MAYALVQSKSAANATGSTAPSVTLDAAPTQGNLLVAAIDIATTATISPTLTGWTQIPTDSPADGGTAKTSMFYKVAGASESATVTGGLSTAKPWVIAVAEFSGPGTLWSLDQHAHDSGTGTPDTGTTAATTQANEICVGSICMTQRTVGTSPTNGWTLQEAVDADTGAQSSAVAGHLLYKIVSATGTQGTAITASRNFAGIVATFYANTAWTKSLSDTVTGTDAIVKSPTKKPADTVTGTDAISKKPGLAKSDTITGTDAISNRPTKAASDSLTSTDSISNKPTKSAADSITTSDQIANHPTSGQADSVSLADALTKGVGVGLADSVTLTDFFDRTWAASLTLTDAISSADAVGNTVDVPLNEIISLADAYAAATGIGLADAMSLADQIVRSQVKALADSLGLSDHITVTNSSGDHTFAAADTIRMIDAISLFLNGQPVDVSTRVRWIYATQFGIYLGQTRYR